MLRTLPLPLANQGRTLANLATNRPRNEGQVVRDLQTIERLSEATKVPYRLMIGHLAEKFRALHPQASWTEVATMLQQKGIPRTAKTYKEYAGVLKVARQYPKLSVQLAPQGWASFRRIGALVKEHSYLLEREGFGKETDGHSEPLFAALLQA